jgi:hypothetical protein
MMQPMARRIADEDSPPSDAAKFRGELRPSFPSTPNHVERQPRL